MWISVIPLLLEWKKGTKPFHTVCSHPNPHLCCDAAQLVLAMRCVSPLSDRWRSWGLFIRHGMGLYSCCSSLGGGWVLYGHPRHLRGGHEGRWAWGLPSHQQPTSQVCVPAHEYMNNSTPSLLFCLLHNEGWTTPHFRYSTSVLHPPLLNACFSCGVTDHLGSWQR